MGSDVVLLDPHTARVRAVRGLSRRTVRQRVGRFVAEGPQAVREALASPGVVREILVAHDRSGTDPIAPLLAQARAAGVSVALIGPEIVAALADTVTPQGIWAVCTTIDLPLDEALARRPRLTVLLSQVRDPGNAGTVIRVADAAGADLVVLSGSSVDVHNPKCVRASAGSIFHVPVAVDADPSDVTASARAAGAVVLAADGAGETDLDDLVEARPSVLDGPVVWVFGNEAHGLGEAGRALADQVVRVPLYGRAESLNLATAAAVCLYATAHRHHRAADHHGDQHPEAGRRHSGAAPARP